MPEDFKKKGYCICFFLFHALCTHAFRAYARMFRLPIYARQPFNCCNRARLITRSERHTWHTSIGLNANRDASISHGAARDSRAWTRSTLDFRFVSFHSVGSTLNHADTYSLSFRFFCRRMSSIYHPHDEPSIWLRNALVRGTNHAHFSQKVSCKKKTREFKFIFKCHWSWHTFATAVTFNISDLWESIC